MTGPNRNEVRSDDGTMIPVWRSGLGPPLLLVHGAAESHTSWSRLLPYLEPSHTVLAMDRRSSFVDPAVRYDLQREFEDVAAVANHLREPVSLVGASSGAVCVLGAAPLVRLLHRLILYEPPLVGGSSTSLDHVERILADGDLEGAAEGFLRDAVKLSGDAIAAMKSGPRWANVVASAPHQIREVAILRTRLPDVDAFAERGVPTLFLTGDKTPTAHHHRGYIEVLKAARVELTVVAIEGQEHFAYRGAPEQFARYVLDFLEGE